MNNVKKKKLREQAITDEMTGMYNRAYFQEFIKMHGNSCYPMGIISADCDGLKNINDTYGHMAGDEYIKAAVKLFQTVLPKESIIFRMGGDEFIIVLPSATREKTALAAEQLKINETQFVTEGQQLSVSLGISVIGSRDDDFDMCIAESDKNMYIDKKNNKLKKGGKGEYI